jgi:putative MATE family efflux protein
MTSRLFDRDVLSLALPAVATAAVPLVHRFVDMAFCRELGTDAIAALSIASVSVWAYHAVGALLGIGLSAIVARYAGAGRREAARYVASQGLRWAAALGVLGAATGIGIAHLVFDAAGAAPSVAERGIPYSQIYWGSGLFVMGVFAGDAIFRAHGNTRTPMRIAVTSLALNVLLDPVLIFGFGPIPGYGVAGAAWATVIATALAAALHLRALVAAGHLDRRRPDDDELRLRPTTRLGAPGALGLDRTLMGRMVRVGLPAAIAALLFDLIYLGIMRCADDAGGAAAQAGLGIGHTGEGVAYVIALGFSAAAAPLVGRALGAGDPERAERDAWTAVLQCVALNLLWGVVMFAFADPLASLFASEADAQSHGATYFRIVAWILAPQAADLVLTGAFGGAGMTLPPMLIGLTLTLARIPLSYFAAFDLGLGVEGIFYVIAVTALVRALAVMGWFRRNTWKTQEV